MRTWLDGVWSDDQKLTYLHNHASQIEYEFGELLDVSPFPIIHCLVEPKIFLLEDTK